MAENGSLNDAVATLKQFSPADQRLAVMDVMQDHTPADKRAVAAQLNKGLPFPSIADISFIWLLIVSAFVAVLVGSFVTLAVAIFVGKTPDLLLTAFTTSAAFLAGLLAPSPSGTAQ